MAALYTGLNRKIGPTPLAALVTCSRQYKPLNCRCNSVNIFQYPMLPNPQYSPAIRPELLVSQLIPRSIRSNFLCPPIRVCLRAYEMLRAAVPKTAVHEDAQFRAGKHYIRFTANRWQGPYVFSESQTQLVQFTSQGLLGLQSATIVCLHNRTHLWRLGNRGTCPNRLPC